MPTVIPDLYNNCESRVLMERADKCEPGTPGLLKKRATVPCYRPQPMNPIQDAIKYVALILQV